MLDFHLKNHCDSMLKEKNICTFLKEGHLLSQKIFAYRRMLYYYYKVHDVYACYHCYSTFKSLGDLDDHTHPSEMSIRLSEYFSFPFSLEDYNFVEINCVEPYKCHWCDCSWDIAGHRAQHEAAAHHDTIRAQRKARRQGSTEKEVGKGPKYMKPAQTSTQLDFQVG